MQTLATLLFITFLASASSAQMKLADLKWLAGCWESRDDAKHSLLGEQWTQPAGGMMLGMGRTVKDGKAVDFEFMRIEQRGDGLVFIARPRANKDDTEFAAIKMSGTEIVFENPQHDFPQRVIYRLDKTTLRARIEGTRAGKARAVDFPMSRVKCD